MSKKDTDEEPRSLSLRFGAIVFAIALIIIGGALWIQTRMPGSAARGATAQLGDNAPRFDLPTPTGERIRYDDLLGSVVVVNFWNSWCIPCKQEEPALREFYRRHQSEADFVMIGIVRDDSGDAAAKAAEDRNYRWIIAFDPGEKAALDFGTRGQPETYVIDRNGVIVATQYGPASVSDLETMLERARKS